MEKPCRSPARRRSHDGIRGRSWLVPAGAAAINGDHMASCWIDAALVAARHRRHSIFLPPASTLVRQSQASIWITRRPLARWDGGGGPDGDGAPAAALGMERTRGLWRCSRNRGGKTAAVWSWIGLGKSTGLPQISARILSQIFVPL
jgi:hypothetical protein